MFTVRLFFVGGYNEQNITMFTMALDSPSLLLHVFYFWGMQRRERRSLLLACKHGEAIWS
jgi:hypothetical protein